MSLSVARVSDRTPPACVEARSAEALDAGCMHDVLRDRLVAAGDSSDSRRQLHAHGSAEAAYRVQRYGGRLLVWE